MAIVSSDHGNRTLLAAAAASSKTTTRDNEVARKRRVLFVNRSYWPDSEATGQLLTELCEDLSSAFDVAVLAGQPNWNPSQVKYARFGKATHNGVDVHRVFSSRLSKKTMLGRVINMASFLFGAMLQGMFLRRPDVIVVETDPPLLSLLGLVLRFRYRCPLVIYLQDLYPDVAIAVKKLNNGYLASVLKRILYSSYRRANQVVVLSRDMQRRLIEIGVEKQRIRRISNWADTNKLRLSQNENGFRAANNLNGQFTVMYSGNFGLTQRLEHVLHSADQLRYNHKVIFMLIGNGATRCVLERLANRLYLSNVTFMDYRPIEELSNSLSAADVHLVPLDPPLAGCLMPSKLYGILAVGRPVIAMADSNCELARVVRRHRVGIVIPPNDSLALVNAIDWCMSNKDELASMGVRARHLAVRLYDRRHSIADYRDLLRHVSSDS